MQLYFIARDCAGHWVMSVLLQVQLVR